MFPVGYARAVDAQEIPILGENHTALERGIRNLFLVECSEQAGLRRRRYVDAVTPQSVAIAPAQFSSR